MSGRRAKNGSDRREAAPEPPPDDDWFEPETTQVDARIEDRSDWARPHDPATVQHIEKMLEEVLVDVPMSPIEDHRAGGTRGDALEMPGRARSARRGRAVLFAVAGIVAVLAAAWLLMQNDLLPIKF